MMDKILLVEDDSDIRDILSIYLRKEGFQVLEASDGEEGLRMFRTGSPDLLLTDILLPDLEGTELTRRIRQESDIPVIMISCRKESESIVDGLALGADDYITKPFVPAVVVARIRSRLRRYRHPETARSSSRLTDGYLTLDLKNREIWRDGQAIQLYAKEKQMFVFLAQHPNQVFSIEQLYEQVWGWDKNGDSRTVMVHIRNLRKKIERDPAQPAYIVTVRGFGYKFNWEAT